MKIIYRVHALRRMFERGITEAEVHKALLEGEEIAAYPDDLPYAAGCCSVGAAANFCT